MFSDIELIKRFGSWVKVQVAFYDFIFQKATKLCPECWKDMAVQEICDKFKDSEDFYERSVAAIESHFETFEQAFVAFKEMLAAEDQVEQAPHLTTSAGRWVEESPSQGEDEQQANNMLRVQWPGKVDIAAAVCEKLNTSLEIVAAAAGVAYDLLSNYRPGHNTR